MVYVFKDGGFHAKEWRNSDENEWRNSDENEWRNSDENEWRVCYANA